MLVAVFENCTIDELERIGKKVMDSEKRNIHGDKNVVEAVANLITRIDCKYKTGVGLFIDWLIQIEPEIIGSSLELQVCRTNQRKYMVFESFQILIIIFS